MVPKAEAADQARIVLGDEAAQSYIGELWEVSGAPAQARKAEAAAAKSDRVYARKSKCVMMRCGGLCMKSWKGHGSGHEGCV